ncbi:hypothetical protein GIB67_036585 [Kingdonia uniflora]|uniref:Uncharacterized protein n=1 Tax=Kingdonia uniflora TaxID=39325 RepID=A0A7J7ME91_9MAGN|nr:hypothetical protein GIB67_036585 [Kingdonia uniflora]
MFFSAIENQNKPEITSIITASSGVMKADEVAIKALNGIKSGTFIVPCNFEGFMLSVATAGLSPQRSFLMAFVEVFGAGVMRFAALFFQWSWYGSIASLSAQRNTRGCILSVPGPGLRATVDSVVPGLDASSAYEGGTTFQKSPVPAATPPMGPLDTVIFALYT